MKKIVLALFCMSWMLSIGHAASLTVTWDGSGAAGSNTLDIDDSGGYESDYRFFFDGVKHTATTDFIVSDGTGIGIGDDGLATSDFSGNGLSLFTGPFANLPNIDQLVLETDAPATPITMAVNNTNLSLEEVVYVNNGKDYAIIELRAVNQGTAAVPIFIAVANDWDVGNLSDNNGAAGFDAAHNMVFQQESAGNYSVGLASLGNPVDQFHIGGCCSLTDTIDININPEFSDPYSLQRHFLNGTKPREECDDGGDAPANGGADTCSAKCHNAVAGQVCGDGVVQGDEECDDANLMDGDDCDHRCLSENVACGNGALDPGEECDDGNRVSGDDCDVDCNAEFNYSSDDFCGDGFANNGATGNQIDPSQFSNYDAESALSVKFASVAPNQSVTAAFCMIGATGSDLAASLTSLQTKADDCLAFYQQNIALCGDGIQNAGEECDDGNTADNDGCDSNCTFPVCGNGIVNTEEACDDGNSADNDGCDSNCTFSACGNGIVNTGEACDDANLADGDGCDAACQIEEVNGDDLLQGGSCSFSGADTGVQTALFSFLPFVGAFLLALRKRIR